MQVVEEGAFVVGRPPAEVLESLRRPELVARVIPGVSGVRRVGDGYVGTMGVSVGALSGNLSVRFRVEEVEGGVVVRGSASGLQSLADFVLRVFVEPSGGGSLVRWRFEGSARGLVAALAPSLVRDAVRKVAEAAAANLARYLEAG